MKLTKETFFWKYLLQRFDITKIYNLNGKLISKIKATFPHNIPHYMNLILLSYDFDLFHFFL